MKKTIILIALIFVSIATMSQIKFGVRGGMTLSSYYSTQNFHKFKPSFHVGGIVDIPIATSKFSFVTGLYFADKGSKEDGNIIENNFTNVYGYSFKTTYNDYQLELPVLFTYKIPLNENLSLKPQIGFYVSYTLLMEMEESRVYSRDYASNPETNVTIIDHASDKIINIGANAGVSLFYKNYSFTYSCDAGYPNRNHYLRDVWNAPSDYPDICMFFSLGYNF